MRISGDAVLRATGNAPSFNHAPRFSGGRAELSTDYAQIAKFVQPGGYVALRLCGLARTRRSLTQPTHLSGLADNRAKCWDAGLSAPFGTLWCKLPRIVEASTRGRTTANLRKIAPARWHPVTPAAGTPRRASLVRRGRPASRDVAARPFSRRQPTLCTDVPAARLVTVTVTPGLW
jgi:hypothetical protein